MNKIFKVKFSFTNNTSVVTSELAKSRGKNSVAKVVVASLVGTIGVATSVLAEPNNEVTQAAGYSANEAITATADTATGIYYNAPNDKTNVNLYSDQAVNFTAKFNHGKSTISAGGSEDNANPKATLSLKDTTLTLTEEPVDIAKGGNQFFGEYPNEPTERFFSAVKVANGGAVYADSLNIKANLVDIAFTTFKGSLFEPDSKIANNANFVGVLAGTDGGSTKSDKAADAGLKNQVVIGGDYTLSAKRDFDPNSTEHPRTLPLIYGIQAVQNNDGGAFGFPTPRDTKIDVPTGKAPQALVTVKGKYTADIKGTNGYGVIVSGKIGENPMPTVNLTDTDITLDALTGSALKVGAGLRVFKMTDGQINLFTKLSDEDKAKLKEIPIANGAGAGELNFKEGSTVNLTTVNTEYYDASVVVSHAGSKLEAGKTKAFNVKTHNTALRVGDVAPNTKDSEGEIIVNINNVNFTVSDVARDLSAVPPPSTIMVEAHQNETSVMNFTSDDTSTLDSHKQGYLIWNPAGKAQFNFIGNGADKSIATGGIVQAHRELISNVTRQPVGEPLLGKLDAIFDNATWRLGHKDGSAITNSTDDVKLSQSILSSVTLKNGAVLDAALDNPDHGSKNFYLIGLGTSKIENGQPVKDQVGTFTNDNSTVDLANNGKVGDYLEIHGNYVSNNGKFKVNTLWNRNVDVADPTSSSADRIVINGNVTGHTVVVPVSSTGEENVIDGEVVASEDGEVISASNVIVMEGGLAAAKAFTGEARTKNISSVHLTSAMADDGTTRRFFWTTKAKDANGDSHTIVDETVPAYTLNHQVNAELGQLTLGTLIERRGEQSKQAWVRLLGKKYNQETDGRFSHKAHLEGIQVHYDFNKSVTDEYNAYSAVFFTYGQSKANFEDKFRAKDALVIADKNTGTAKASSLGLGVSHTVYANTGIYLDSVFHVAKLKNKFASVSGVDATQKGTSFALSLEAGKSFSKDNWRIEPQAQLTYQFTKYNQFTDGAHVVEGYKAHDVRARLGSRFTYDFDKNKSAYVVVNVVRKLTPATSVSIGNDVVDYAVSRTTGELGLGGKISLGKNISVYSDVRVEKGFDGLNYGAYRGNVGLKYSW